MSKETTTPSTGSTETQEPSGETPQAGETPPATESQHEAQGATPAPSEGKGSGLDSALKAEREARKKAEKDLAELRKQQDEGLSETDRLAKRVQELEAARKAAERDAIVLKVSNELGLPSALSARLRGDDEDAIRQDAEALKAALPQTQQSTPSVGGPQGPPASGRTPQDWRQILRQKR